MKRLETEPLTISRLGIDRMDLYEEEGEGAADVATMTVHWAAEGAPPLWRADPGGKGKERAWAEGATVCHYEAGLDAGGDDEARSVQADSVGAGQSSAGGSRAAEEQSGKGSRKRAALDGDEVGGCGGAKRARVGKPRQCEHNRRRSTCKGCAGTSICEHMRQRSRCRECGGASVCPHDRRRRECKECGGASICQHTRRKSTCKECRGASICEHDRRRSTCKECGGGSICQHNRIKSRCKECRGGSICQHNRERSRCKKCIADKDESMPSGLEEL